MNLGAFNTTDLTTLFELLAFYQGSTSTGLLKYDISTLFSFLLRDRKTQIIAYFEPQLKSLKYIETEINNKKYRLNVIEELKETDIPFSDFDVPPSWACHSQNITNITDFGGLELTDLLKIMMEGGKKNGKRFLEEKF